MRSLLSRLGARGGVAVGLVVLVLAVVAVARLTGNQTTTPNFNSGTPPPITVNPTEGDDGEVAPAPSTFADDTDVRDAAVTFAAAWLRRDLSPDEWHERLSDLSTDQLAESLVGVDPSGVPATRTTGDPSITLRTERFAQVTVPADSGALTLSMLKRGDAWLVDGIDWGGA